MSKQTWFGMADSLAYALTPASLQNSALALARVFSLRNSRPAKEPVALAMDYNGNQKPVQICLQPSPCYTYMETKLLRETPMLPQHMPERHPCNPRLTPL